MGAEPHSPTLCLVLMSSYFSDLSSLHLSVAFQAKELHTVPMNPPVLVVSRGSHWIVRPYRHVRGEAATENHGQGPRKEQRTQELNEPHLQLAPTHQCVE
jgi:hypothetical protein